jgi:WD40 repeat protein
MVFTADGKTLAVIDGTRKDIRFWETTTGKELASLPAAGEAVADGVDLSKPPAVALSADGRLLAASGFDRSIRIWRLDGK